MPSGAFSLLEAAKASKDQVKRGTVETLIIESPLIEMLHWTGFQGNALQHFEEGTVPSVNFRRVNEGYTPSYGSDNSHFWGVAILGGEAEVDNFLVNVVDTEGKLLAKNARKLAKANAMRFDYEALEGTGSVASKGFKGIKTLIDEGFGQKLLNASGGGALTLAKLDEANDLLLNTGGADFLLANRTVRRKVTSLARETHTGISLIDIGTDVFGRQVTRWNDIPIKTTAMALNSSGTVVNLLDFNEDPGDATSDTTSVYFVKTDEDNVTGLLGKGGTFEARSLGENYDAPARKFRMEWYPGIAIFSEYSIVRLYGITNA
jgi:hypothetical protein